MHSSANGSRTIRIIESVCHDPAFNIAYEAHLTETLKENESILFLWRNAHTIVIGRNQNPWKECQVQKFEADGGRVIRRLSGGGAVYHDMGNLNFSIIDHESHYSVEDNIVCIQSAMQALGLHAEFTGKNDLTIQGRKFSGHAFFRIGQNHCHHGAVLVDTNLTVLSQYLTPSKLKLQTKSVDSVRARVTNLSDMIDGLQARTVAKHIEQAYSRHFGEKGAVQALETVDQAFIENTCGQWVDQMKSWGWTFTESPKFDVALSERFSWGTVELGLSVEQGRVSGFEVYTDCNETEGFESLKAKMQDAPFDRAWIEASIRAIGFQTERIGEDILSLLRRMV